MKLLSVTAVLRTTSTDKDVQTEPDTMDNALVQNFRKNQKEREEEEEEEEEENDVLEEEKCKVKAY